jgi:uncharacterized protein
MDKKILIPKFLSSDRIAVAGVSRNKKKFGYTVYKDLRQKGYNVVPINPSAKEIDGDTCYTDTEIISGNLDALLLLIPPAETVKLIKSIKRKDIQTIWMQPGSESAEAVDYCRSAGLESITGECILMYAKPEGFHNVHRFFKKVFGKLPV